MEEEEEGRVYQHSNEEEKLEKEQVSNVIDDDLKEQSEIEDDSMKKPVVVVVVAAADETTVVENEQQQAAPPMPAAFVAAEEEVPMEADISADDDDDAPIDNDNASSSIDVVAAEDAPSIIGGDAPAAFAASEEEEAPTIVVAALSIPIDDAPPHLDNAQQHVHLPLVANNNDAPIYYAPPSTIATIAEEEEEAPPSVDAEYGLKMVAEEALLSMAAQEALRIPIKDEAPPFVDDEEPSPMVVFNKEALLTVAEDELAILAKDAPSSQSSPLMVNEEHSPHVVAEEDAPPTIAEEVSSMVEEDVSPGIDEHVSPMIQADASPDLDEDASPMVDETASPMVADDGAHVSEADTEMDMETEIVETGNSDGKKRKRGRPAKAQAKPTTPKNPPAKRTEEEDVCFICFDGGNLVLCDRRGCPKAYHPTCVNRDEAFFRSKGRWNCGWHICSNCEKAAHYMCYTCTYSLCKGCIKDAEFFCVRGNRGFCETCMRTVMLIEKNELVNKEMAQVDFDDKSSWEYLFKEYWIDLKGKLSLTLDELTEAKNPLKGFNTSVRKGESSEELYDANDDKGSESDGSTGHLEGSSSKKRKAKRRSKSSKEEEPSSEAQAIGEGTPRSNDVEWASKELLEFVAHMKNNDKSALSQFEVQALLLDYIKQNKLRDPRRKSQIVCDSRLVNLFGKARVGHFEMLKLLELHFLIKEDTHADDIQGATADTEGDQLDGDGSSGASTKASSDKRRKSRKKGDGRGPQTNLDDYAAIDVHNIKLLFLRRNLMEDLLDDSDKFHEKVVGSFVRIRISGSGQKQDMYRLVQVVGTRKATEPYKTGKRSADVVLEILNLNKTEVISIDTISNQEFSEDECKRLRQSIKCGLISRMTVGEVQEKAMSLQAVRVNDWLETEKLRISHLRDRASEQGRRKELRECVEKLQLLKTPEERFRRLQEVPEVHADPNMDPNYESEEDEEQDDRPQDKVMMPRETGFNKKGREPISPGKGSPASVDTWSGARKSVITGSEPGRNMSTVGAWVRGYGANGAGESVNSGANQLNSWEKPINLASGTGLATGSSSSQAVGRSGPSLGNSQELATPLPTGVPSNISEADKTWHYQDPSGKIQGPFSMVQLRKWSTTGHFPVDLRIWRATEKQEDSILLSDALVGKYNKELPQKGNSFSPPQKSVALPEKNREVNWGNGWEGSTNMPWTDKNRNDRTLNSNWKDVSGLANGSTQLANNDVWSSGSSSWAAPTTVSKGEQFGHSSHGGWDSRGNNAWAGQSANSPHSSSSYSGQPQRPTFPHGGQGGGRWNHGQNRGNNWNANRYRGPQSNSGRGYDNRAYNMGPSGQSSGETWGAPPENSTTGWGTGETPKPVTGGWDLNQNRSNSSNLPSPTPQTSRANWTDQVSENKWSPTPNSSFPANTNSSPTPTMGSNGGQLSYIGMADPNKTTTGWTEQQHFSVTPNGGWGEWGPSSGSASVPKPAETSNQDGRVDYSNPPTPTPVSAGNYMHP